MTILEAMREPITVQGLVNLALGIFLGLGLAAGAMALNRIEAPAGGTPAAIPCIAPAQVPAH